MKKIITILFSILLCCNQLLACLNGDEYLIERSNCGHRCCDEGTSWIPAIHSFIDSLELSKRYDYYSQQYKSTNQVVYLSYQGVILIILKKYDEAIKLYLEIEELEPNQYATAANIGTAYELAGQTENALEWIQKAAELNPYPAINSERLHVKILEAKLKGAQCNLTSYLLKSDFGVDAIPRYILNTGEQINQMSVYFNFIQERIAFIKTPDKMFAQLLFDMGNISFLIANFDDTIAIYKLAKEYGFSGDLIDKRLDEAQRLSKLSTAESLAIIKSKKNAR